MSKKLSDSAKSHSADHSQCNHPHHHHGHQAHSKNSAVSSSQSPQPMMGQPIQKYISVRGAKTHNLKNINVDIPAGALTVITGLSGSGKSSLAFDTLYAEGQRRYVESLSSYARQFLEMMEKPDVDSITGLSPAISIEQKATSHNPRSTVGTVTEIHDYLRLLYARCGDVHCPDHGILLTSQTVSQMVDHALAIPSGTKIMIAAPMVRDRKGEFVDLFKELLAQGFTRVRVDGEIKDLDDSLKLEKTQKHNIDLVVDRLVIQTEQKQRLAESFETAIKHSDGNILLIEMESDKEHLFSSKFGCPVCSWSLAELEPRLFSFNSPMGACPQCDGLGATSFFDPKRIVPDEEFPLAQGAIVGWDKRNAFYFGMLEDLAKHYKFSLDTPWKNLSDKVKNVLLNGSGSEKINFTAPSRFNPQGNGRRTFEGVAVNYARRYRETDSSALREEWSKFVNVKACSDCGGSRLRREARAVTVSGHPIYQLNSMSIESLQTLVDNLTLEGHRAEIAEKIQKEIGSRLRFLNDVGLGYLSLSRSAETLSGGEAQRIRLASQIGSGLTGVMYVLDEPSIGLHQRDNDRLISTMKRLRDLGNSVIVVEHDQDAILAADYVLDIGPGAGVHGGQIMAAGTPDEVRNNPESLTGAYLSGVKQIAVPSKRRQPKKGQDLQILGCTGNNLKNVNLKVHAGLFNCVCGISGSGKSTLVNDTLYRAVAKELHGSSADAFPYKSISGLQHFDKVIDVDQSPIGRTPRSNPATYTGLFTHIRELFAQTSMARERGYEPGRFSFNVKGGRCEACQGDGMIKVEMHFLPDMYVPCETCEGQRYNRETLEVQYKGKNISQVLAMTVEESLLFFSAVPTIKKKLDTLHSVGLGYIKLGQAATTLSGGEAQRVKLSLELSRRDTGKTLYILDEPTTGLHFQDVDMLLTVLHKLVDHGNTVVVIEHNLDVIKTADWIIDVGPEGGDKGGFIVAEGTPEEVASNPASATGPYLAHSLQEYQDNLLKHAPQATHGKTKAATVKTVSTGHALAEEKSPSQDAILNAKAAKKTEATSSSKLKESSKVSAKAKLPPTGTASKAKSSASSVVPKKAEAKKKAVSATSAKETSKGKK